MLDNMVSYLIAPHKFSNVICKLPDLVPPDYVRVKYEYCGICGGDHSRFLGYRNKYPISLGHEFVAQVLDINSTAKLDYTIGDYVVSDFNYRCMKCSFCKRNESHLCIKNDVELFTNRAFSQYADIHYSYLVRTKIPAENIYRATTVEPLSCIIHAMNHYDLSKINSILVYGTGNIGMLCAFYLSCCLDKNVYIVDKNKVKEQLISSLFPCKTADIKRPYDLIIEATNNPLGLLQCICGCIYTKNICSFSHLYGQETNDIYDSLVKNECSIYFPLRNGKRKNLCYASEVVKNKWKASFDKLIQIYETNNINLPFEDKDSCNKPKQVIKYVIEQ